MADHTTTREDGSTVTLGGAWGDQAAADEAAGLQFDPTAKSDVDTVMRDIPQIAHTPQEAVIQNPTASISVSPATDTLAAEETSQLTVTDADSVDVTADASYSTSDAAVATVSQSGLVTAVATGSATITAEYAGKTDTCAITVS